MKTTRVDGVMDAETRFFLLDVVALVAELVMDLGISQKAAADAPRFSIMC